jgi:hypothetical protein
MQMHLGDFIYEYGPDEYPSPAEAVRYAPRPLGLQPPNEIITLSDYRQRYSLYRRDPGELVVCVLLEVKRTTTVLGMDCFVAYLFGKKRIVACMFHCYFGVLLRHLFNFHYSCKGYMLHDINTIQHSVFPNCLNVWTTRDPIQTFAL